MQQNPTDNIVSYGIQGTSRSRQLEKRGGRPPSRPPAVVSRESLTAERLEAAGRLAAWLAHQINNPLGAISGNAQLLARRLQRDIVDPEVLKVYLRHLEAIQSHTERCAGITAEALSLAQAGEPALRKLDACELADEAISLVRYAHPSGRIDLVAGRVLPPVRADREWLVRVLFELVSNAAEASDGGLVTVRISATRTGEKAARVRFRVIDSGPGIAEDDLSRVFDPFYSTREKARGIGLTLSLEMVRKMGGTLEVEKSGEHGSVFTVSIPVWGRGIDAQASTGCRR